MHLLPPRGRPPACHRRGRSPLPPPSRDRADGATLGRPRHEPRRTRRPALRVATPRAFRKRQAPPLQNCLCFREGGRRPPQNPQPLPPRTTRSRSHRLAALRPSSRDDLASPPPETLIRRIVGASIPACPSVSLRFRAPLHDFWRPSGCPSPTLKRDVSAMFSAIPAPSAVQLCDERWPRWNPCASAKSASHLRWRPPNNSARKPGNPRSNRPRSAI